MSLLGSGLFFWIFAPSLDSLRLLNLSTSLFMTMTCEGTLTRGTVGLASMRSSASWQESLHHLRVAAGLKGLSFRGVDSWDLTHVQDIITYSVLFLPDLLIGYLSILANIGPLWARLELG